MNWSKYNIMLQKIEHTLIYNSLSNSFLELDNELIDVLKSCNYDISHIYDKNIKDTLIRAKVFVEDDEAEINKIKFRTHRQRFDYSKVHLTINPTLACNFECPYCFEGSHPNLYMTDEVEDLIIKYLQSLKRTKRLNVTWLGGEPLLAFPRIRSLTRKMLDLGFDYRASMVSNGYMLTREVAESLYDLKIGSIQITIDGPASVHDSRRCLKGGKPTFDRILENIDYVHQVSPKVRINIRMNIDNTNKDSFIELYNLFKAKNYTNVSVHPGFVKPFVGKNRNICSIDDKSRFYKQMLNGYGLNFGSFYPLSSRYECAVRNPNSIVVGPEGELYKCWNDIGNKDRVYGHISGRVTNEAVMLQYLVDADPFEDKKCRECILLPVCSGGCPYDRLMNQIKGADYNVCPLIKHNLEEYLLIHYNNKLKILKSEQLC